MRLGWIAAACVFALLAWHFAFVCDDAYISLRYARHLAAGEGLRFNVGENPPVEGYSNLLWVLLLAAFEALHLDGARAAIVVSALAGLLLLVRATLFAGRELALDALGLTLLTLLLATLPPFFVWATGGLETMPFALAVFLVFEFLAAREPSLARAAPAALAATWLRPDGLGWTLAAALAALALRAPAERRPALRVALRVLALALAAWLAQLGFRVLYHGDWLAETVRIKAGLSPGRVERGACYLASQLLEAPLFALAWLGALAVARRERAGLAAALMLSCAFVLAIGVGGDFMAFARFLVPAAAFALLGWGALGARCARSKRGRAAWLALSALALAASLASAFDRAPVPDAWRQALHFRFNEPRAKSEARQWAAMKSRAEEWLAVGRALALHARPGESIVLGAIGASAYPNELFVLDRFGLVTRAVADVPADPLAASPGHDKHVDAEFFFPARPTYLGAWLAPATAPPEAGLPADFAGTPAGRVARVERWPLPADGSFPAGFELRVLRASW